MIRTVMTAENNILKLPIPEKYIGRKLEIIAFALDESMDDIMLSTKDKKTFIAIKINTKGYKFNRDEIQVRLAQISMSI